MAPVNSVRHLFLRKARNHLGLESKNKHFLKDGDDDDPVVAPGDMHLNSFYAPALDADTTYAITSTEKITIPGESEPVTLQNQIPQTFQVFAPQFKLEDGDIHSYYPPHAHSDLPYVLPHIVFSDPHLPWERGAKFNSNLRGRNRIPWLALLVFDGNAELKLTQDQLSQGGIFPDDMTTNGKKVVQDNLSYAVPMTWDQLNRCSPVVARQISSNDQDKPSDITTPVNTIFLPPTLYTALFASTSGSPPVIGAKANLDRYKYLAHYRNINTAGMAGAGVEDEGLFSIVMSHRTGPLDLLTPRNVVVHLVSIDGISDNVTFPLKDDPNSVGALISLFSWNYRCLPPSNLSFVDSMRNICKQSQEMLRPPQSILDQATAWKAPSPLTSKLMNVRLRLGYSMVRYRVQTGEETVAFVRGALSPVPVDRKDFPIPVLGTAGGPTTGGQWPAQSNSGVDYQILDPDLGIMDLTYSTAWQLGRSLALADTAFSSALTRYRCAAYTTALANAKTSLMKQQGNWRTQKQTIMGLQDTINVMAKLHLKNLDDGKLKEHMRKRWNRPEADELPDLSMQSPEVQAAFKEELHAVIARLSSGTPTKPIQNSKVSDPDPDPNPDPYNEFNSPYFADWPLIQAWLLDRMYLASVPSHYLITDKSHLPPESLRFFYIDPVWVDCLLDGALSIANHLTRGDDIIRQKIKDRLNKYLTTPIDPTKLVKLYPQVPISGFFLRSAVVEAMPDLQVAVPYVQKDHPASELIRHEIVDKGTMLVLLDRNFDDPNLSTITFSQPPHQQFYWIGDMLTTESVELLPKKLLNNSTSTQPVDPNDPSWGDALCEAITWRKDGVGNPASGQIYDWSTYLIQAETLATTFKDLLNTNMAGQPGWKQDDEPSAAVMAFQLNATNYYGAMVNGAPKPPPSAAEFLKSRRQIYVGEPETSRGTEKSAIKRSQADTKVQSRPIFHRHNVAQTVKSRDPPPHVTVSRPLPPHGSAVSGFKPSTALLPNSDLTNPKFSFPLRSTLPQIGPPADQCWQGNLSPTQRYTYTVFPSALLPSLPPGVLPKTSLVPTDMGKKIDIAIGVNLTDATLPPNNGLLYLRDVEVAIPVRTRDSATANDGVAALTYADYGSAGELPTLLSNARWVVKTSIVDAATYAMTKHPDHPIHKMHPDAAKKVAHHRRRHHYQHHHYHSPQHSPDHDSPDTTPGAAPVAGAPSAYMVSRLIPRSTFNMVYFTSNPSCSILLPLVEVDPYIPPPSHPSGSVHAAQPTQAAMTVFCTDCYWLYPQGSSQQVGLTYGQSLTVMKGPSGTST